MASPSLLTANSYHLLHKSLYFSTTFSQIRNSQQLLYWTLDFHGISAQHVYDAQTKNVAQGSRKILTMAEYNN